MVIKGVHARTAKMAKPLGMVSKGSTMIAATALFVAGLVLAATPAGSDTSRGLAVFGLKAQRGVDAKLALMLDGEIMSIVKASKRFTSVLSTADIRELMGLEEMRAAMQCDASSCIGEIGGALGVPYLLTGDIGRIGPFFMVNLRLLSVEEARALVVKTQRFVSERELAENFAALVSKTIAELDGGPSRLPA